MRQNTTLTEGQGLTWNLTPSYSGWVPSALYPQGSSSPLDTKTSQQPQPLGLARGWRPKAEKSEKRLVSTSSRC